MKLVNLTKGYQAIVDDVVFEWINQFKWHVQETGTCTYAASNFKFLSGKAKVVLMHWLVLFGEKEIDHINRNGLDNRMENLRACTHSQNIQNKSMDRRNSSGIRGVYFSKRHKIWEAEIYVNNQHIFLGSFPTKEEARIVRLKAAAEYHGQFAGVQEMNYALVDK